MFKPCMFLVGALIASPLAEAQIFQRELGDFDLKLGTTPSRSMAQGLVKPTSPGSDSFHGGLDLSHDSGLYFGQFSPNMGLSSSSTLEVDSYMGFKHPFDQTLGYEVGLIHYSYPKLSPLDSQEFYGGLNLLGNRFGASFSNDPDRQDSTLFADLGGTQPFGIGRQHEVHHSSVGHAGFSGGRLHPHLQRLVGAILPAVDGRGLEPDLQRLQPQRRGLLGLFRTQLAMRWPVDVEGRPVVLLRG